MKTRLDLLDLIPKDGICAELGVFAGEFSEEIIKRCEPSLLYLVDAFDGKVQSGNVRGENMRELDMDLQQGILEAKYFNNPHVSVVRGLSWEWLDKMPEESLDFVYIDTNHTLQCTRRELASSWRAVKPGGYIAGHDYHSGFFPGVVQAVGEFCDEYGLTKQLTTDDRLESYLIRKP